MREPESDCAMQVPRKRECLHLVLNIYQKHNRGGSTPTWNPRCVDGLWGREAENAFLYLYKVEKALIPASELIHPIGLAASSRSPSCTTAHGLSTNTTHYITNVACLIQISRFHSPTANKHNQALPREQAPPHGRGCHPPLSPQFPFFSFDRPGKNHSEHLIQTRG